MFFKSMNSDRDEEKQRVGLRLLQFTDMLTNIWDFQTELALHFGNHGHYRNDRGENLEPYLLSQDDLTNIKDALLKILSRPKLRRIVEYFANQESVPSDNAIENGLSSTNDRRREHDTDNTNNNNNNDDDDDDDDGYDYDFDPVACSKVIKKFLPPSNDKDVS